MKTCIICGRTEADHRIGEQAGTMTHQLVTEMPRAQVERSRVDPPVDPVLRFLLVSKGIITADELAQAATMLGTTGMLVTDAGK